jgi:hypothetical protein
LEDCTAEREEEEEQGAATSGGRDAGKRKCKELIQRSFFFN